jgi:hypothetical protein
MTLKRRLESRCGVMRRGRRRIIGLCSHKAKRLGRPERRPDFGVGRLDAKRRCQHKLVG